MPANRLICTDEPVVGIAFEAGYESEAAFNRALKRNFGTPPARPSGRSSRRGESAKLDPLSILNSSLLDLIRCCPAKEIFRQRERFFVSEFKVNRYDPTCPGHLRLSFLSRVCKVKKSEY